MVKRKFIIAIFALILNLLTGASIFIIYNFDIKEYFSKEHFGSLLLLPLIVIMTTLIHEGIHIIAFIYFGKGQAKIKISRNKKLKAIVVNQINKDINYTKTENIIILLSPMILITIFSASILSYTSQPLLIYLNCILNCVGSFTDMYISLKLSFNIN